MGTWIERSGSPKSSNGRVPTQVHTRTLDRLVAHTNMKRAGIRHVNKHDYSGPAFSKTRIGSYFSEHWRDNTEGIATIDLRRKNK